MSDFDNAFEPMGVDLSEEYPVKLKLNKLVSARKALEGCWVGKKNGATYTRARKILHTNYGRDAYVVAAWATQLASGSTINTDDTEARDAMFEVEASLVFQEIKNRCPEHFVLRFLRQGYCAFC